MSYLQLRVQNWPDDLAEGLREIMEDPELQVYFSEMHEGVLNISFEQDASRFGPLGGYRMSKSGQESVLITYATRSDISCSGDVVAS